MVNKRILCLLAFILVFTSGCWDMKDIEERIYVSGVGFDKPEQAEIERQKETLKDADKFTPRYLITYLAPVPDIQTQKGKGEEGYNTRSITSISPSEAERQINTRVDKDLYFGHAEVILFGEEVLKDADEVRQMFDYLHRYQGFNWNVLVGVVQGKAQDALNIKPKGVTNLALYITGIMQNRPVTASVADVKLTQTIVDMGAQGTVALPRVVVAEDEVKVEGAAVIKNFKLLGYLNGVEGRSIMFLKGTIEGGSVIVNHHNNYIPYSIVNASVEKELKVTEEGLQLTYHIKSEGQIDEGVQGGVHGAHFFTDKNMKELEEETQKEIVRKCSRIVEKLQKEMKVDIIYADRYIKKYHPKIWEQIKDDYLEHFEKMDIRVTADVKIRRAGVVK